MKKIALLLLATLSLGVAFGQKTNPNYDEALAKKLKADEFGMKQYVFVVLKTGSNKSTDEKYRDSCFTGHLNNIERLAAKKELLVAGPFRKNESDFRGLFILNVSTIAAAEKMLETDPAIKEGFLKPELYLWYGSAALPEYLDASDKVWKKGF